MSTILKVKILSILAVMLISIYFIAGFPRSRSELLANLRNNIRLGSDLRGGSHLTLQVHLQDAFNGERINLMNGLTAGPEPGKIGVGVSHQINFSRRLILRGRARGKADPGQRNRKNATKRTEPMHKCFL